MKKPYSEAANRNKIHILEKLKNILSESQTVLEIGSGTGQHAVYFAEKLTYLVWQTADLEANHEGIKEILKDYQLQNVLPPLVLDVNNYNWNSVYDCVYSANTLHIISWKEVEKLFVGVSKSLREGGLLIIYGPFNYNSQFTSQSNADFDEWLKQNNPKSGIRDFEKINELAAENGFDLKEDFAMPANNRLIYWQKV